MTFFQRFYPLVALVVGLGIWAFSLYVVHAKQGWARGLWVIAGVLAFGFICWLGNRRQSLNDKAKP